MAMTNAPRTAHGRGVRVNPYAGMPSWRQSMAPRTWKKIPFGNTFAQANPALNPALNLNYPNPAPWAKSGTQSAVLDAWCSIWPHTSDGRIFAGPGGGHGDYYGNELYYANLGLEVPLWQLLKEPSGAGMPDGSFTYGDNGDVEPTTGIYAQDGRVRGNHNYNNIIHLPGTNKLYMSCVTALSFSGKNGPMKSWYFDTETGNQTNAFDYSSLPIVDGSGEGSGVCYDSTRNVIWHIRNGYGLGSKMLRIDLNDNSMRAVGVQDTWVAGYARMHYIPTLDIVVLLHGSSSGMFLFNPTTETWTRSVNYTGTLSAGLKGSNPAGSGNAWVPSLGGFLIWNQNSGYTTEFTLLKPPSGNLYTGTWTYSVYSPSISNTVTPPAIIGGTGGSANIMGRCQYLPFLKGFFVKVDAATDMYFFSTE